MNNKILDALKELGIENKTMFSVSELEAIAKKANTDMFNVMYFLF